MGVESLSISGFGGTRDYHGSGPPSAEIIVVTIVEAAA